MTLPHRANYKHHSRQRQTDRQPHSAVEDKHKKSPFSIGEEGSTTNIQTEAIVRIKAAEEDAEWDNVGFTNFYSYPGQSQKVTQAYAESAKQVGSIATCVSRRCAAWSTQQKYCGKESALLARRRATNPPPASSPHVRGRHHCGAS